MTKYFLLSLLLLSTFCPLYPKAYSDTIAEASIEIATREADRKVLPDNFQRTDRQIYKNPSEDEELPNPPDQGSNSSLNNSAEELPPCSPGKLTLRGKY